MKKVKFIIIISLFIILFIPLRAKSITWNLNSTYLNIEQGKIDRGNPYLQLMGETQGDTSGDIFNGNELNLEKDFNGSLIKVVVKEDGSVKINGVSVGTICDGTTITINNNDGSVTFTNEDLNLNVRVGDGKIQDLKINGKEISDVLGENAFTIWRHDDATPGIDVIGMNIERGDKPTITVTEEKLEDGKKDFAITIKGAVIRLPKGTTENEFDDVGFDFGSDGSVTVSYKKGVVKVNKDGNITEINGKGVGKIEGLPEGARIQSVTMNDDGSVNVDYNNNGESGTLTVQSQNQEQESQSLSPDDIDTYLKQLEDGDPTNDAEAVKMLWKIAMGMINGDYDFNADNINKIINALTKVAGTSGYGEGSEEEAINGLKKIGVGLFNMIDDADNGNEAKSLLKDLAKGLKFYNKDDVLGEIVSSIVDADESENKTKAKELFKDWLTESDLREFVVNSLLTNDVTKGILRGIVEDYLKDGLNKNEKEVLNSILNAEGGKEFLKSLILKSVTLSPQNLEALIEWLGESSEGLMVLADLWDEDNLADVLKDKIKQVFQGLLSSKEGRQRLVACLQALGQTEKDNVCEILAQVIKENKDNTDLLNNAVKVLLQGLDENGFETFLYTKLDKETRDKVAGILGKIATSDKDLMESAVGMLEDMAKRDGVESKALDVLKDLAGKDATKKEAIKALKELAQYDNEPDVAKKAMEILKALADDGNDSAIEALRDLAKDGNKDAMDKLIELAKAGNKKALDAIKELAKDGNEDALNALRDIAIEKGGDALDALAELAKKGNEKAVTALKEVAKKGKTDDIKNSAVNALKDIAKDGETDAVKDKAIDALKNIALSEEAGEAVSKNALGVLKELAKAGNEKAIDAIVDVLKNSKNLNVQIEAAKSLGEIGGEKATNALIEALGDHSTDPKLRLAAIDALVKIYNSSKTSKELKDKIKQALKDAASNDPNEEVKNKAQKEVNKIEGKEKKQQPKPSACGGTPGGATSPSSSRSASPRTQRSSALREAWANVESAINSQDKAKMEEAIRAWSNIYGPGSAHAFYNTVILPKQKKGKDITTLLEVYQEVFGSS
jgi:HEAT repeat protein